MKKTSLTFVVIVVSLLLVAWMPVALRTLAFPWIEAGQANAYLEKSNSFSPLVVEILKEQGGIEKFVTALKTKIWAAWIRDSILIMANILLCVVMLRRRLIWWPGIGSMSIIYLVLFAYDRLSTFSMMPSVSAYLDFCVRFASSLYTIDRGAYTGYVLAEFLAPLLHMGFVSLSVYILIRSKGARKVGVRSS